MTNLESVSKADAESGISMNHVTANDVRFAYLECGEGPLVLLLHGFPDNAWTYREQLKFLAKAGYRAVAPFMRGYAPTEIPSSKNYDPITLGEDVCALIKALSHNNQAHVIGMDWGGTAIRGALTKEAPSIRSAIIMNTAHQSTGSMVVRDPSSVHLTFHVWFFQLDIAPIALAVEGLPIVDYLFEAWSPTIDDPQHVESVKATLSAPGVIPAALEYYKSLINLSATGNYPMPIMKTPTLAIYGEHDGASKFSELEHAYYSGPFKRVVLDDVGHWPHLEKPQLVNSMILDWIQDHE
jgi:pimeloyl-ACP methyl ester carboxylesterase